MKRAHEYRQHAEECRALARTALSESERDQLLGMADTWLKLAVSRESFVALHPELSRKAEEAKEPPEE